MGRDPGRDDPSCNLATRCFSDIVRTLDLFSRAGSACPACRSESTHLEHGDRHQCDRCGWRFILQADGTVRDFISVATAGRKQRKRGAR
ncbi:MAG: hypothetical protein JSS49_27430 [Planctomycetes bacterium]|nr:hypothetical protein [Planctomycetota bacterium]